ncbi:hypothetical protein FJ693_03445, partial [Georgenia yuyongxinii]
MRHTTFRFCLDPTVEQAKVLSRHVGAGRFAYNQCLRLHLDARRDRAPGDDGAVVRVPWSGFDLINAFNAWKRSTAAGRRFVVDSRGAVEVETTGLLWREEVLAQVFEEAAVDLGRALRAWTTARAGAGRRVGHPRFKKKTPTGGAFRIRNKTTRGRPSIRVGQDGGPARAVTLPKIGTLRVRDDTRRLRRMIAKGRARVLFATITRGARRWWISLTVEAADLHPRAQHPPRERSPAAPGGGGSASPWRPRTCTLAPSIRPAATATATATATAQGGSAWTGGCRRWWSPAPRTVSRPSAPTPPPRCVRRRRVPAGCPRRCRESRKDRTTAPGPWPGWPATTPVCATGGSMSCIRSRAGWSRPTTGSSW